VTLFKLDEGVDTGPILAQEVLPLTPDETATSLYDRVQKAHSTMLRSIWPDLESGNLQPINQDDSTATYWEGRRPHDGEISADMTVQYVERLVRALCEPYPGAYFVDPEKGKIVVWSGRPVRAAKSAPGEQLILELSDGFYLVESYELVK